MHGLNVKMEYISIISQLSKM